MPENIRTHYKVIIATILGVILVVLGCYAFNFFSHGVWALPFARTQVAVVKTTERETGEEKYYTIYSNGTDAQIDDTDALIGRDSNVIPRDSNGFTATSDDLSQKVSELRLIAPSYFRDGETIFVVGLRDTGFGGSSRKVYAYDVSRQRLRYLGALPTGEEVGWAYLE